MAVRHSRNKKKKKPQFPSGCISGILFFSETELSTERKTKIPLCLVEENLKWAKKQAKKSEKT